MQGLKIPVILLVFVGVLGLALVGDHLVHGRRVLGALASELGETPGVASARVEGGRQDPRVLITPSGEEELFTFYPRVVELVEKHLGSSATARIELLDERTPLLEEAFQHMRFAIEEAIATGHFTQLTAAAEHAAEDFRLDSHAIHMDSDYVYVRLTSGQDRLFAVIIRPDGREGVNRS